MDQVNNKLNKSQYTKLNTIIGSGAALNKTKERQNVNEQIFQNNLLKESQEKPFYIELVSLSLQNFINFFF